MGTGKSTKGHGIKPLAWKTGISNAIEAIDAGAIKGHR
jgi:hypothetical protein